MKARIRRRTRRPPDLTSLFDVLFIVVFVALIRAAAAEHAVAEATKPPPPPTPAPRPPAPPPDVATLRAHALATVTAELATRAPLVLRISERGVIDTLEVDGARRPLDAPLLEHDPDPTVRITYAGDRAADHRVCAVAAHALGVADLARYLVILAPARASAELPEALIGGLERDVVRCQTEQRAIASIVPPVPPVPPVPSPPTSP